MRPYGIKNFKGNVGKRCTSTRLHLSEDGRLVEGTITGADGGIYVGRKILRGWRSRICSCCIGKKVFFKCRSLKKKERRLPLED